MSLPTATKIPADATIAVPAGQSHPSPKSCMVPSARRQAASAAIQPLPARVLMRPANRAISKSATTRAAAPTLDADPSACKDAGEPSVSPDMLTTTVYQTRKRA